MQGLRERERELREGCVMQGLRERERAVRGMCDAGTERERERAERGMCDARTERERERAERGMCDAGTAHRVTPEACRLAAEKGTAAAISRARARKERGRERILRAS